MTLSQIVEELLKSSTSAQLTEIFLWATVVVFAAAVICKKIDKYHSFTNYTPVLLTSLGILGTFAGIISGLLDFDTHHVDESISGLLEGLKTAFITSLWGMSFSILFKIVSNFISKKDEEGVSDVDAAALYAVMKQQAEGIMQIKKAISENDETSLVGQFKLLRSDLTDNHKSNDKSLFLIAETLTSILKAAQHQQSNFTSFEDQLWIKLRDFADMLSKSATEQVIEALKQVIADFNNNLTEQFGENFKELNKAVLALITWQENYKEQLGEMRAQYDHGVQAITQTQVSVACIGEDARAIPAAMESLKVVMAVNQNQINDLGRHLVAFKDVRDKAVEAVPEIRARIDDAIEGSKMASLELAKGIMASAEQYIDAVDRTRGALTESAQATANSTEEIKQQFSAVLEEINSNMRNLIAQLLDGGKTLNDSYKQASSELVSDNDKLSKSLANTIEEMAQEQRKQADRIFAGLEKTIESTLSQTGESVHKQVAMIDKTMEEEISRVMKSMGAALASISGKFTQDYSQLVKLMSDITSKNS